MSPKAFYWTLASPIGPLLLTSGGDALTGLHMAGRGPEAGWIQDAGPFRSVVQALDAYFEGELARFDVPLDLGGTPFQQRVWSELREIPFGRAISYAELARRVGKPGASRAVGSANGRNPVSIIVPCHRVIASDGGLGGYGGGLDRKRWLLEHEIAILRRDPRRDSEDFPGAITPKLPAYPLFSCESTGRRA
ncbi:Methylated-DNA--protein-cysteine methyltransferase [Aquisphaera giovannonii]|uniref:Methylated-DNA--protein-cysteine methyltransferase n=1 Tax=Aquisphaera giovannonii TaxID=406548 RepID=A0A5B9W0S9_9BACT|nr:methylated-DNA--[protein]-cysteine S-methyltransferase [Aquisphaera giovannonii]QEH33824.1 Methylated-DNA--protein-cysteine methyltransferase [Aquisphaera giovannonii]